MRRAASACSCKEETLTKSRRLLNLELAGTTMMEGANPIMTTGVRSASLNGMFFLIMLLEMTPAALMRKV